MGWNSWDNFATTVTEAQTKAQADVMARDLKAHGWEYIVVDIQWYEPGAESHAYRDDAVLEMDGYGRLQPAPNRFPSSADGRGFTELAEYVHGQGLKFGVHLMRGIPRQAVKQNLPVLGTEVRAQDIADTSSFCPWNPDMYGVDMSKPGAQAYYDSVFDLFASWGVDYVKVDDISRPYHDHEAEIEAIRTAIDQTGRPMVLSLSPGATALSAGGHVSQHANLWRISDDFWDRWIPVHEQFARLEKWNEFRIPGAWPDADMLPFGVLELGKRRTRFTQDEQLTVMTLWSIARSPLMFGGDLTKLDPFTLSLLNNDEVIAVNQLSSGNRPLFERDELIAWIADAPDGEGKYLAVFNARDQVRSTAEHCTFASEVLSKEGTSEAAIDVELTGGDELILFIDAMLDGPAADRGVWQNPLIHFADGSSRSLTLEPWKKADSLWDSAAVRSGDDGGKAGIAAQLPARISYALPSDAIRFTATGVIESWGPGTAGTAQFIVSVGGRGEEASPLGVEIPVEIGELGFDGPVHIRDLWTGQELGEHSDVFAPLIPFRGCGLYRIQPSE